MSELLKNTKEKARMCRANGNDIAADEYDSYADRIEQLEAQVHLAFYEGFESKRIDCDLAWDESRARKALEKKP